MRSFVAHRTPTRIRIKIAKPCRLPIDFLALELVLLEDPDVLGLQLNPLTGSLIIKCKKGFELKAQHQQLLGLEMEQRNGVQSASHNSSHAAQPHDRFDTWSGGLILLRLLKLILAISNKQLGTQLIEWASEILVQTLRQEIRLRAGDREPLHIVWSK